MNIDINAWATAPALTDRTATADDLANCLAAFASEPGETQRLSMLKLPARATYVDQDGTQHDVIVIQGEYAFKLRAKLVGFIIPNVGMGVATLDEMTFLD
ncbi:MAG: hypothetical protein AB8B82_12355 [Roseovarius sp.]